MVWYFTLKNLLKLANWLIVKLVLLVYDGFKIFNWAKTFQNISELTAIYAAVVKKNPVYFVGVECFASSC